MYPITKVSFKKIIGALFALITIPCFALDTDKAEVAHVSADKADLSQKKHLGVYIGNVLFTQGSTNLIAQKAVTKGNQGNQLELAIAYGSKDSPAHYWTKTDEQKPPFHAFADTIKYFPLKHQIQLLGHAKVEQGKNSLSADKIIYDTLEQHVVTQSNGNSRTTIILYPQK